METGTAKRSNASVIRIIRFTLDTREYLPCIEHTMFLH